MKKTIIIAAVAVLALAGCVKELPADARVVTEAAPATTEEEVVETTVAPTTEAPTTTQAPTTTAAPTTTEPPPPPPTEPPYVAPDPVNEAALILLTATQPDCWWVDAGSTSSLIPYNWDEWCAGLLSTEHLYRSYDFGYQMTLCDEFWVSDDNDLHLMFFNDGALTWDQAIGAVDFFWTEC